MEDDQLFADLQSSRRSPTLGHELRRTLIAVFLDTLEPRRRASLILAIIDGRTHAEISKYLGIPVGTVKAWVRRELIALR
jgi:RNA polymerase sigma-70 factor, ECF subfamily